MRTAQTIAAQDAVQDAEEQTADSAQSTVENSVPLTGRAKQLACLKPWKPGQSGNPGGRPKNDVAAQIARAIFEQNPEMLYQAFGKALSAGNAYAFQVLSDRAFGKLTERSKLEVSGLDGLAAAIEKGRKRAAKLK